MSEKIGSLLLKKGAITPEQLDAALAFQKETGTFRFFSSYSSSGKTAPKVGNLNIVFKHYSDPSSIFHI